MITVSERLAKFQELDKFTDVSFELDAGNVVKCHRVQLAAVSVYLKLLFKYDQSPIYHLPDKQFYLVFHWAYKSEMPENCNLDCLLHADYLGVVTLLRNCTKCFLNQINTISNFGWLMQITYVQTPLLPHIVSNLAANFKEGVVGNMDEYCLLPFDTLISVLRSEFFYYTPEIQLWVLLKQWILSDLEHRRVYLRDLVTCLKMGLMPLSDFRMVRQETAAIIGHQTESAEEEWRRDFLPIFSRADEIQKWKHSSCMRSSLPKDVMEDPMIVPRTPTTLALVSGGWSQHHPVKQIELFDYKTNVWYTLPSAAMPSPRAYHDTVVIGDKLYCVGGFAGEERFKSMVCLDLQTLTCIGMPSMKKERCYVSAVTMDGMIYCMGGFDGASDNVRLSSVEMFDPRTNKWMELPDMLEPRSDAAAVTHEGRIYSFGGFNGNDYLDSVEFFDINARQWTAVPRMHEKRGGIGGTVFKNKIYALGGYDGQERLRSVELLDPVHLDRGWTYEPPMKKGRSNFGVCSVDDRILVTGGYVSPSTTVGVEWFDGFDWWRGEDMKRKMSALTLTPIRTTPALQRSISPEKKNVLASKRLKRITAFDNELSPEDAQWCLNQIAETDTESRMFDTYIYTTNP